MSNDGVGNISGGNGNVQWSKQLADKLDAADGKKDGKISASVWNDFITHTGSSGNKIANSITCDNASKSFVYYDKKKDAGKVDWGNWENMFKSFSENEAQPPVSVTDKPIVVTGKVENTIPEEYEAQFRNSQYFTDDKNALENLSEFADVVTGLDHHPGELPDGKELHYYSRLFTRMPGAFSKEAEELYKEFYEDVPPARHEDGSIGSYYKKGPLYLSKLSDMEDMQPRAMAYFKFLTAGKQKFLEITQGNVGCLNDAKNVDKIISKYGNAGYNFVLSYISVLDSAGITITPDGKFGSNQGS